jgi:RHS repeat-associated protein
MWDGGWLLSEHRYDITGRLVQSEQWPQDGPQRLTYYGYNGLGDRYGQTTNGQTTNYLLDLSGSLTQVLAETVQGGSQTTYLPGLDIIGQQTNGQWTYNAYDGLGSLRQVTDYPNGAVQYAANYDPYGGSLESYGTPFSSFGFTGEQSDANGLLYLRARYYDPGLGGFLARDPVEGVMARSNSRNGYSYVEGNPVNYRDPSGECLESDGLVECYLRDTMEGKHAGFIDQVAFIALYALGTGTIQATYSQGGTFHASLESTWRGGPQGWKDTLDTNLSYFGEWWRESGNRYVPAMISWPFGIGEVIDRALFGGQLSWEDSLNFIPLLSPVIKGAKGLGSRVSRWLPHTDDAKVQRVRTVFSNEGGINRIRVNRRELDDPGISLRKRRA